VAAKKYVKAGTSRAGRWSDETAKRQLPRRTENILSKYGEATPEDLARGRDWYATAHHIATRLGGGDVHKGAGIIAALSPQKDWDINLEGAHHIVRTGTPWRHTTSDNNRKALRILSGEHPNDVLNTPAGHKVYSFYRNIVHLNDPNVVTIDKHAHDIAMGIPPGYRQASKIDMGLGERKRYDHFVQAYASATHKSDEELPSTMQAITWVTQRRQKGL
jgi:hypothetical protein